MLTLKRNLIYSSPSGDIAVGILVHPPQKNDKDWRCAYEITWPDKSRQGFGYGIDSVQALLLALQTIGADLYTSDYHRSGRLRWNEPGDGYGFPVPRSIQDLLIGQDAVEFG